MQWLLAFHPSLSLFVDFHGLAKSRILGHSVRPLWSKKSVRAWQYAKLRSRRATRSGSPARTTLSISSLESESSTAESRNKKGAICFNVFSHEVDSSELLSRTTAPMKTLFNVVLCFVMKRFRMFSVSVQHSRRNIARLGKVSAAKSCPARGQRPGSQFVPSNSVSSPPFS